MSGKGLPPWFMWGDSKTVTLSEVMGNTAQATSQLNRINYGRPDTWHWLFVVTVVGGTIEPDAYNGVVDFDVTIGIGRTSITIPSFVHIQWSQAVPILGSYGQVFRTTTASGGPLDITLASQRENLIDSIVAQDIQVQARVAFQTPGTHAPPATLTVKLDSYWAPSTHIRPEWFKEIGEFRGNEDDGS